MDENKTYTTQMTQKLTKLKLIESTVRTGPELSLKNAFERNFSTFAKVNFSSPKQVSHMFFTVTIPTESKYEGAKINH
jgi:hypothetical protein